MKKKASHAHAIVSTLIHAGIRHFCIGCGSRNTPLIFALEAYKDVEIYTHLDERGLGFLALGLCKGANRPVAVIVTSGTACGNLLPAVMEAHESNLPLILLTADRPYELQSCGANQTTHQESMFHFFVRHELNIPSHEEKITETVIESKILFSLGKALGFPKGPIHLNCQFREPFDDSSETNLFMPSRKAYPSYRLTPSSSTLEDIAAVLNSHEKGIILLGKESLCSPLKELLPLLESLSWPVFADPLGQVFEENFRIKTYSFLCKNKKNENLAPTCVLHLGGSFVSKDLLIFLKKCSYLRYIHVSDKERREDPEDLVTDLLFCSLEGFVESLAPKIYKKNAAYFLLWKSQDEQILSHLSSYFDEKPDLSPPSIFWNLSKLRLESICLFIGNSMPIRDLLHFFHPLQSPSIFGNRGLSGIDGNIATACGLSLAQKKPLLMIVGDMTFLHDLNSLLLLKQVPYPVKILVINNNGGGIFSFLAIKDHPLLERFFTCPHGLDFSHAAELFGINYTKFSSEEFSFENLEKKLFEDGHTIIELSCQVKTHINHYKKIESTFENDSFLYCRTT